MIVIIGEKFNILTPTEKEYLHEINTEIYFKKAYVPLEMTQTLCEEKYEEVDEKPDANLTNAEMLEKLGVEPNVETI